ncbi:hypothetical protein AMTRI_Chr13g86790 [Amborella trichopoda]
MLFTFPLWNSYSFYLLHMAPAQMITGVEQESVVENSTGLEGAKVCEILNSAVPKIPYEESLECTNQSRETDLTINDTSDQDKMNKDIGCDTIIDIEGNVDNGDVRWSHAVETTECSSSFGDTLSSLDDDCKRIVSDQEVESQFHGENGFANVIDDFNGGLRLRYKRRKPEADAVSVDDDYNSVPVLNEEQKNIRVDDFGASHAWVASEMGSMETSPEQLLWSLEGLQSRILKLKGQLNKVKLKNADKFSSVENSIDRQASAAQSPQVSPVNGDSDPPIVGLYNPCHDILDFGRGDLGISGSGVSRSYMVSGIPDLFGIYSDADVPFDPPHIGDACGDLQMLDEVLIENQAALGEDLPGFGKVREEEIKEEEQVNKEERGSETAAMGLPEIPLSDDGFAPESESLKTKRKRALRRGASRGWNVKGICNNC